MKNSIDDGFREELTRAIELYNLGRYDESLAVLLVVEQRHPDVAAVQGLLGRAYFNRDEYDTALVHFSEAVRLNPDSEMASLGLFQCLLETGNGDKARDELYRFTSTHESLDYSAIAAELGFDLPS